MPSVISRSVGGYAPGEAATTIVGRLYKNDSTKRPVIYFTGGPGDDRDFLTAPASGSQIAPRLVDAKIAVISAAFGGAAQWGNDTAQARIGQAFSFVQATLGTKGDKFVGVGISKGATAMLNYARNNPSKVAALVLIVPAVNVSDIYDNDRSGLAAAIDAAYGGSWASAKATHDPALNTATHAAQGIPMKLCYGGADTTIMPQTVLDFAAATGATAVQIGPTLDHLTTAPAMDPIGDVLAFIDPHLR